MSGYLQRHACPDTLPDSWDLLAQTYWQSRAFLSHTHATHPCAQRYYTWYENGHLKAGAVVYTLPIDILTYFPIHLPVSLAPSLHVCGIPASVSSPGIFGTGVDATHLLQELTSIEQGWLLALNLDAHVPPPSIMATGNTLPTVVIDLPWKSIDEYTSCLRADYRRRFVRIRAAFAQTVHETTDCSCFTSEHYAGYRHVLAESHAKLETLPFSFFTSLPSPAFELTTLRSDEGNILGWFILLEHNQYAAFFLGGMPLRRERPEDLYFHITSCVLERAIARGARFLDFGQTAEVPKLRLGGRLEPRFMAAYHSNTAIRLLLHAFAPMLSYHRTLAPHHVFRQDPHCS